MAAKTKIVDRSWSEPHPARSGAPAGADKMSATIERYTFGGRDYLTEVVMCNGVVVNVSDYPDGTDYAKKRIAKWSNG